MTWRRCCLGAAAVVGVPVLLLAGLLLRRRSEVRALAPPPELAGVPQSLDHGGLRRTYDLFVPPACRSGARRAPLVLALHGGGGMGVNQQQLTRAAFNRLAAREGFILAYPDGVERHWNDGRTEVSYRSHRQKVDDVGFLRALVARVDREHGVDPARVYVTGMSNGAMMSHRAGVELSTLVAAIAPVGGSLPRALAAAAPPGDPVSVIVVRGTADPLVPWAGGQIHAFTRRPLGDVLSAEDEAAFWVARDGCAAAPRTEDLPDAAPDDGTRVRRDTWSGGRAGTEVVRYAVLEGGHTWPGGWQYFPASLVGPTCRDVDATELIWDFFTRHPKAR